VKVFEKAKKYWAHIFIGSFIIFLGISELAGFQGGINSGKKFVEVVFSMIRILPCAFILISLFEVWVERETVIKHLGEDSGIKGYIWAILLGGMTVGGMFVAFPLAYTLSKKGASLKVIFCFIGFAGVCRIPMTIFEITCMGWKFTLFRLTTGIVLCLISGIILGSWLEKKGFELTEK
jgi:uncharacterized membrane protein YraQ (UPF0718 family)